MVSPPPTALVRALRRARADRLAFGSSGRGGRRMTVAVGPSLMASGAPPCPPLHPMCPGGLSGRGGGSGSGERRQGDDGAEADRDKFVQHCSSS
jgi:hypothetical protein